MTAERGIDVYKIILKIDGMSCGMCEAHINDTIRNRFSIKKIKSSYKKGMAEILSEEKIPEEELRREIDPTGYKLVGYSAETAEKKHLFW